MFQFKVQNELTLKVVDLDGCNALYSKAGAWIATAQGKTKFDKVLLGPQGQFSRALIGHIQRRLTGENLPLMKVMSQQNTIAYYADRGQHISVVDLTQIGQISVESENILAFTDTCSYSTKFVGTGVISQRGLFTSTLTAQGEGAMVAILSEGNPLELTTPCQVDPDAVVAWTGPDPNVIFDVGWKTFIGQSSGESYQYDFRSQGQVILVQPYERGSGIALAIDGSPSETQGNQTVIGGFNNIRGALNNASNLMNDVGNFFDPNGGNY